MPSTSRRRFLQQAGQATALGYLGTNRASAAGRIAILADPSDAVIGKPPAQWAMGELRQALEAKGANCAVSADAAGAGDFSFAVALAGADPAAAPEGFSLTPTTISAKPGLRVRASDARGYVYALTELADRVRYGGDPVAALTPAALVEARPANPVRSIARAFVSEVEDKPWFYDRAFWRDYLTALATNRFNRFSLTPGLGLRFPARRHAAIICTSPTLTCSTFRAITCGRCRLTDAERDRNLETLRFIGERPRARGLEFQLGIWTHAYQWTDSPRAHHHIEGLTPETHAPIAATRWHCS